MGRTLGMPAAAVVAAGSKAMSGVRGDAGGAAMPLHRTPGPGAESSVECADRPTLLLATLPELLPQLAARALGAMTLRCGARGGT
jgi:hypothetical protein